MMSNIQHITIQDFENICRTCLSRKDLKSIYEKYWSSKCVAEMLMSFTSVKFSKDDGFPIKICTNCINEINQAFSFAKRCETTDAILRKCVTKIKNNLSLSQKEEIKPEIVQRPIEDVLGEYEFVKQDDDVKIIAEEYEEVELEDSKIDSEEFGNDKQQENVNIAYDYDTSFDVPMDENYENMDQHEMFSVEEDIKIDYEEFGVGKEVVTKVEYHFDETLDDPAKENYENVNNQDETLSETFDHPDSRPRRSCRINKKIVASSPDQDDSPQAKRRNKNRRQTDQKARDLRTLSDVTSETNKILDQQSKIDGESCKNDFVSKGLLRSHAKVHKKRGEKARPYACDVCTKAFFHPSAVRTHMRVHTGEKPYICGICSKGFSQSSCLVPHMRKHTGEEPYSCEICLKSFTHRRKLRSHNMKIHNGKNPYSCEVCNKVLARNSTLITHMRLHTGEKPHTCKICSKSFSQYNGYKYHMSSHSEENPYTCKFCGKGFCQQSLLIKHLRSHTGEKPHTCGVCSQGFTEHANLIRHMQVHTGEKPYPCGVCNKRLSRSASLITHMRLHTGERPYTCRVCSKGFTNSSLLNKHMKIIHKEEKPFPFEFRSKAFSNRII